MGQGLMALESNINIYRKVILNCLIKCGITKLDVATEQVHATTTHTQCGNAMACVITMELRNAPHSIPPAGAAAAAAQTGICCSRTFQHCNTLTHYSPLASAFWSSNIKGRVTEIIKQSSYQKQTQGQTFLSSFTLKETLAPIDRTPGIPGSDKKPIMADAICKQRPLSPKYGTPYSCTLPLSSTALLNYMPLYYEQSIW